MSDVLAHLNPIQQKAVETTSGPVLVLSGPGSGKTRVITHRIAHLIKNVGVEPNNILAVTFTNKASNEMKERIKNLLSSSAIPPWMGTFHSVCSRILRLNGNLLGLSPHFVIYDENDQLSLIKEVMNDLGINPKNFNPGSILNSISSAKNELIDPVAYQNRFAYGFFQETVAKVYLAYQENLRKNQALDFDDLLMETVRLFQEQTKILDKYQEQFQYILVDEYQDTNHAQYLFTKLLASKKGNLCVVGDASQAIYGWRGANYKNILNFERDFPQAQIFNLEQNYRSTKKILSAATSVISRNKTHPVLKIWTENDEGNSPVVYEAKNEIEEAEFIIRMIKGMIKGPSSSYSLGSFAILYRTNAQSRVLEEALLHDGLPYVLVGGTRFYERKEIKDILAYLRFIANPKDLVGFKRIVNVPPRGIGPAALKEFALNEGKESKVSSFLNLMESFRVKGAQLKTLELIDLVVSQIGYLTHLDDGTPEGQVRIENVKELRSVAAKFPKLDDFLENVALVEQEYLPNHPKSKDQDKEVVTLMTMHAAKGLEFPIVFMVGMEEGLFPHSRSLMDPTELEEERRLCYVGITRAKEQIYLTYTQERLYFGARTAGVVSRFLTDIPQDLIVKI
jgi:DNA helicase-2/ATP-dependent DNA helicase PcrA